MRLTALSALVLLLFSCRKELEIPRFNPSTEPVKIATTGPGVDRVDALSFTRLRNGDLFGSFSYWVNGQGGDNGNSYQQVVISRNGGESYEWKTQLPYQVMGDLHASHHQQRDGNLIMLYLSQSDFSKQEWSLVRSRSFDGGHEYISKVYVAGGLGSAERWIAAAGRIHKLRNGWLIYPISRRGFVDLNSRRGFLFLSKDDGNTWEIVESGPGMPLTIINSNASDYATEPGVFEASNGDLYYYFRSRAGFVRGCRLRDNGRYLVPESVVNIVPAPASSSDIKYIPSIGKYMAVHNDVSDVQNGNMGTGRNNLIYSLSETGQPGSFVKMPNRIKAQSNDGKLVFEPSIFADQYIDGVIVSYTVYSVSGFTQYARFLSSSMLLSSTPW